MDQDLLPVLLTIRYMLKKGLIEPGTPVWPGLKITGGPVGDIEVDVLAGRGDLTLIAECKKTASFCQHWLRAGFFRYWHQVV